MKRTASAKWQGDLKQGKGTVSTASTVLTDAQYSFRSRFEEGVGTNPEELIGAAHAGCFAMALSAVLGEAGFTPEEIVASATVTMEPIDGAPTVTKSHLDVTARVPGASEEDFLKAASEAKQNCPISRLLKAEITMDARLEG
jgi:osmotically inducible protein OsmC